MDGRYGCQASQDLSGEDTFMNNFGWCASLSSV